MRCGSVHNIGCELLGNAIFVALYKYKGTNIIFITWYFNFKETFIVQFNAKLPTLKRRVTRGLVLIFLTLELRRIFK